MDRQRNFMSSQGRFGTFGGNFQPQNGAGFQHLRPTTHPIAPPSGQFRHPKPFFSNPMYPPPRPDFKDSSSRFSYQQFCSRQFAHGPTTDRKAHRNTAPVPWSHNNKPWKQQRPRNEKSNGKFDINKYFKESMLQDPWEGLIQKQNLEGSTTNATS